jgi:ankyrin repeat protein
MIHSYVVKYLPMRAKPEGLQRTTLAASAASSFWRLSVVLLAATILSFPADCRTSDCRTLIAQAASEGNPQKRSALAAKLGAGACLSSRELGLLARSGEIDMVQAILSLSAEVQPVRFDVNGPKPAGQKERPWDLDAFIAGGGYRPPDPSGFDSDIPLVAAASAGKLDMVKWLLEHGASIDLQERATVVRDFQQREPGVVSFRLVDLVGAGNNALSAAVICGRVAVAQFLVAHGADVLRSVVFRGAAIPSIRLVGIARGSFVASDGRYFRQGFRGGLVSTNVGITPEQELDIIELMAGSAVPGMSALGKFRISTVSVPQKGRQASLVEAARKGDIPTVRSLLAAGADPNGADNSGAAGTTPLIAATEGESIGAVGALLEAHADVNARDNDGFTVLHLLPCFPDNVNDLTELLLANGARVDARDNRSHTPLHLAAIGNCTGVAQLLLAHGAEVDAKDSLGATPLHYTATLVDGKDVAALLLAYKADVDARAIDGSTTLHMAALNGRAGVAELLLAHGASVNATTGNGSTPLRLAVLRDNKDVAELLRRHGGHE